VAFDIKLEVSAVTLTLKRLNCSLFDSFSETMPLNHPNGIFVLPDELIANTLKYTDYKTVVACRRVGPCPFPCQRLP
jgi:hypothetical protein